MIASLLLSAHNCQTSVTKVSPARDQAELGVFDLTLTGFMTELMGGFYNMIHAPHMRLGMQAAMGIQGQFAVKRKPIPLRVLTNLPPFTQPERFPSGAARRR